jgi:hypothetical protein
MGLGYARVFTRYAGKVESCGAGRATGAPYSSLSRRLQALATRLGIHVEGLMLDCARSGKDWEAEIRKEIGEQLTWMQLEMWDAVGPGRPPRRPNKVLARTDNKETLRKRRWREKKRKDRDKYSN